MRKLLLTAVATAATACLALSACGPGGGSAEGPSATGTPGGRASATTPASTPPPAGGSAGGSATPGAGDDSDRSALALGVPSRTVGTKLVGILEITPTTVVHAKEAGGTSSRFGSFAVIATKDASLTANAADEEPANGTKGGWRWIADDGQSVAEGNGAASKVSVRGYDGAGAIGPGTSQLRSEVFDLTPAQAAAGGTLVYTDATGTESRWRIPAVDSGPQVADVGKRLAS